MSRPPPPPPPPEGLFSIRGFSPWPFDCRRSVGPWSQRHDADVYGNTPAWARALAALIRQMAA